MRICVRSVGVFFFLSLLTLFSSVPLCAQQRLDLGVHLTPQLLFVRSERRSGFTRDALDYTEGGGGVAVGFGVGAYLEYEVLPGLSLRAGVDMARKRYAYDVWRHRTDSTSLSGQGVNRIVFMAMEVPVSVIYRFGYLPGAGQFLVGAGGVIARHIGDPQLETEFFGGSSNHPPFTYSSYSLKIFAGYERYLGSRFVAGLEPYLSYAPQATEFLLESRTTAVADLEIGVAMTLRFDN